MEDPRLDCGHPVAGRDHVTYCNCCIERLAWERDEARRLVRERDATISDLAQEIKRLLAR